MMTSKNTTKEASDMPPTAAEMLEMQTLQACALIRGERRQTLADLAGDYALDDEPADDSPFWGDDPFAGIPNAYDECNARY